MNKSPEIKAEELLKKLSLEEKICQLSCQMLYPIRDDYEERRMYKFGNFRNPGHFLHEHRGEPVSPAEVTDEINRDIRRSMECNSQAVPPIEHAEALHGAQWGMATCFPQPIGMASMFDDELVEQIGDVIGKECAVVGVRQALTPVVNVVRDCRWGRTIESFGEDVLINSDMGAAICRGLQKNGVIATPKHYADNYSYGGRDSNVSETCERTMREVYLKPFEKCIKQGGAMSIMAAYNSWDGVPCTCNEKLLTDILRNEWGFEGFVVSDYNSVEGVWEAHRLYDTEWKAQAASLKAGMDVDLPQNSYDDLMTAYKEGWIDEADIDRALMRVLTAKYSIGLMDKPFADRDEAQRLVRCEEHKKLALETARRSMVLLKNDGVLPLNKNKIKKLAVFGMGADVFPVGENYSGPFEVKWTAEDAKTPLQYLREYLDGVAEVIFADDECIEQVAAECDAAIYMTALVEGEGLDRSDIRLPGVTRTVQKDDNAVIVGKIEFTVTTDQEESIRRMTAVNSNSAVVLLNGSPVDMSSWLDGCGAVLEAWFPGEQGAQAICEILFGDVCPSGKLPITFPRSVGQLPLFYSMKPSGRGYGYIENDGSPLYPFGYGLSYTSFKLDGIECATSEEGVVINLTVENTGDFDGAEVVQVYLSGINCDVVMPLKELKAYKRVELKKGEKVQVSIPVTNEAFCYYDRRMVWGMHNGDYNLCVATSCTDVKKTFEMKVRDKEIILISDC
ncbi:MAG: glycoside hydrolase family 3 C-terminal domain-containing protein [Clostridia bacterium]|nr:glycoside hydrolase family 3 C-terminal domain-containing protein [Clostridia bacterium]